MGRSKADLPFGNESMLQRVTRLLSTVVRHIVVVAAAEQQIPDFGAVVRCPVTIARDDLRFAGPLAGLGIGLRTLHELAINQQEDSTNTCPLASGLAYVTSCDVPFLEPKFVQELFRAGEEPVLADGNAESPGEELAVQDTNHAIEHYDIVLPVDEKYAHPLSAAYRLSLTDTVQKLVADGERRPRALFDMVRTKRIPTQQLETIDPGLETLMNLNAPQEYADALRRAGFAIPQWVDEAILNSEDK